MQWSDEGIILSVKPHGETAAVAEIFTRAHGRHLGLVHGGRSRKHAPRAADRQSRRRARGRRASPSTSVTSTSSCAKAMPRRRWTIRWRSPACPRCALWRVCCPSAIRTRRCSRWPCSCWAISTNPTCGRRCMVRWELALLDELGFGLDLLSLRGDGQQRQSDLRLAQVGTRRVGIGRSRVQATACCACRPSCARDVRGRRRSRTSSTACAHRAFPRGARAHPARGADAGDTAAFPGSDGTARRRGGVGLFAPTCVSEAASTAPGDADPRRRRPPSRRR